MRIQEGICRFCSENCKNLKVIDRNTKNLLDILLQRIEFTVIQDPVMCKNCEEMLVKCYEFKAMCLDTRDFIASFVNNKDNIKLDLKDVYLKKSATVTSIPEHQDICGFCMGLANNISVVSLDVEKGDAMLEKMIEQCLPELDLSIIKRPVICAPCHGSLETCFHFVTNCLIVEERIKKYLENIDVKSKDQIKLRNLLEFTIKDVSANVGDGSSSDIVEIEKQFSEERENADVKENGNGCEMIKLEQTFFDDSENANADEENKNESFTETDDQKINNEYQDVPQNMWDCEGESNKLAFIKKEEEIFCAEDEPKLKTENLVEMEDQKFLVNEEIEIKTDEQDFNRFEDGSLSQAEITYLLPNLEGDLSKSNIKDTSTNNNATKIRMYKCVSCSYSSKHKDYLKRHTLKHKDPSEVTMYKCDACLYRTKRKDYLKVHIMLKHKDPSELAMHKCQSCSFQTVLKNRLKTHLLVHKDPSEVKMYKCDSCAFQTKNKHGITKHLLVHKNPSEVLMYKCNSCAFQTKRKYSLINHFLVHKEKIPSEGTIYKCNTCSYQTVHKNAFEKHSVVHEDSSEVTMYKCDFCSFQTKHKSGIRKHLLVHKDRSEVTTYKCDFCSLQSTNIHSLRRHMMSHKPHSEITMYKCDSCSYQTRLKYSVKKHMLTHKDPSEVAMYKCDYCPFQTKRKDCLNKHVVKHKDPSEVTMFKCDSCSFQTKHKESLRKHLQQQHKDPSEVTMYKCDYCSFQTKSKHYLRIHSQAHKDRCENQNNVHNAPMKS